MIRGEIVIWKVFARRQRHKEWVARQRRIEENAALREWAKAVEEPEKAEVLALYGEVLEGALKRRKAVYQWMKEYREELERRQRGEYRRRVFSMLGDDDLM